ncbi:MAG: hypothetical protein GXP63_06500 [DPANN group archaeon]|nr:hypothetical protein [DPANN group archaeon]
MKLLKLWIIIGSILLLIFLFPKIMNPDYSSGPDPGGEPLTYYSACLGIKSSKMVNYEDNPRNTYKLSKCFGIPYNPPVINIVRILFIPGFVKDKSYCKQASDCITDSSCGCSCSPILRNKYHSRSDCPMFTCGLYCSVPSRLGWMHECQNNRCVAVRNETKACLQMCEFEYAEDRVEEISQGWHRFDCSALVTCTPKKNRTIVLS